MNEYLDRIRRGEAVTITGKTPNLGHVIFVILVTIVMAGVWAWCFYQEEPAVAWIAVFALVDIPFVWMRSQRLRKSYAIHLGPEGLRTRGVWASWSAIAHIDTDPIVPRCVACLRPGSTVRLDPKKDEVKLRNEVARYHGIRLEMKGLTLLMSQIATLCRAAKAQWGGVSYQ